ncbi:uncharacterized protein [Nicotiana sylvestris]|uniref:uncharacterized protein n=1 Tax=Nicotiana sylvestris TaxID=4096 RepID=UPI00388C59E5
MLTTEYELFRMKDDESIQDMHTRFTSIVNELHSLGDVIPRNKLVRKILSVLPSSWESKTLAAWGDSSSELEREPDAENNSMMVVETKAMKYDSLFALMAQSDDDEEDEDDEIRSLANVLIDATDKEILTTELGEAEQTRDDLVLLSKRWMSFLVIINDLEEIIEGINREHRTVSLGKGKEVATEIHIKLEKELTDVKTSLCGELEKNRQLQAELEKVKIDLEKSLKWTWYSNAVTAMYLNNSGNSQGIGFQREKTPYNPHSKYVTVPHNLLCTHCGNNGHFKEYCQARVQSVQKNKGTMRGSGLQWTMDSGCSKHVTRRTMDFFSLKALQEGNVFFLKRGYILSIGKVGKSLCHSIQNVYYMDGLKYNIMSVSQIYDKGNKAEFLSKGCTVTNLVTSKVVLEA